MAILADAQADDGQVSEIVAKAEAEFVEPVEEPEEETVAEVDAEDSDPEEAAQEPVAEEAEQA